MVGSRLDVTDSSTRTLTAEPGSAVCEADFMAEPLSASVPPSTASQELMEVVLDIAKAAGDITLRWFQDSALEVETKGDGTPVTQADKAAERYIRERIQDFAPNSTLVGEEEGSIEGTSGLTWYIDPIDGTKGFARGVPLYSTLIAVNDEYGPAVGVIHIPATSETVWAGRGLGCFSNNGPARVSSTADLSQAYVTTSSVSRWGDDVYSRVNGAGMDIRGWGDGYGFLMVATGRMDGMIDLHGGSPWDYAPMPVIFSEAGGRFSALDGTPSIDTPSVVATNGVLHDAILGAVNG